jgi:hypothetical protein
MSGKSEDQKAIVNLFILDASYSMNDIKSSIIEGFNSQAYTIKRLAEEMDIPSFAGLISFSSAGYGGGGNIKTHFMADPVDRLPELNNETYECAGGTPLYDAIGGGIEQLDEKLGQYLTACNVVVTILTDGEENTSQQFCGSQISDMIKEYTDEYGWTFNFIGANIDIDNLSSTLNIAKGNTLSFDADEVGAANMMATYATSMTSYYKCASAGEDVRAVTNFMAES